jgi:hypothetical protein
MDRTKKREKSAKIAILTIEFLHLLSALDCKFLKLESSFDLFVCIAKFVFYSWRTQIAVIQIRFSSLKFPEWIAKNGAK